MSNFQNENVAGIISRFPGMKKYAAPVVLFVLACALIVYLKVDFSGSSTSFDVNRYMQTRAKIDSLEIALWNAQGNVDTQVKIRDELSNAWEDLSAMRSNTEGDAEESEENVGGFSSGVLLWIIGGSLAVLLCAVILVLVLIHRKKVVETRMMEALAKAKETGELPAVDDTETITTTRVHAPKKSIIDEAQEFAAKRRETMEMQTKTGADVESSSVGATKAAFEDEHGVPENRILTSPFNGKTVLRPTARERITSAMQSLSDVLHHDRSKVSHPKEQTPPRPEVVATAVAHPLEMNRFDRESSVNSKILQMSRRGFPASAIASKLKIPQAKVEAVIKEAVEAGN
ncbi:hypothetical protein SAMN05720759_103375 [Fibrobacter sp. UWB12]|nr:hypothetical protein SAMN05720759_103375 [Fibrobacter sp. UWB12]